MPFFPSPPRAPPSFLNSSVLLRNSQLNLRKHWKADLLKMEAILFLLHLRQWNQKKKNLDHKHTLLSHNTWGAFAEILSTGFFPEAYLHIWVRNNIHGPIALIRWTSNLPQTPNLWRWVRPCLRRRWWGCVCSSTATALATIAGWTCCSRYWEIKNS